MILTFVLFSPKITLKSVHLDGVSPHVTIGEWVEQLYFKFIQYQINNKS